MSSTLSRRNFIKSGAAGAAFLGLASTGMLSACSWIEQQAVGEEEQSEEYTAYTYHSVNCGGRCSLKCTVRDGKLVNIEPNDWPDSRYSLCCLKGLSEIERVYSADRIQTPMKRVGERGAGQWEAISWDEAIQMIVDAADKTGGKDSILCIGSSGLDYKFPSLPRLIGAQQSHFLAKGIVGTGIDNGIGNGIDQATGDGTSGAMQTEVTSWVDSKVILMFGNNMLETGIGDSQFFFDAKEAGAQIIVFDPNYSVTAAKANRWIPIEAATDHAFLLAMISLILENKWYNEEYLVKNTSMPFLINTKTGKLLRGALPAQTTDPATGKPVQPPAPFKVWDATANAPVDHNTAGAIGLLEGSFKTPDGVAVTTVFNQLLKTQEPYSPEWAAEITHVPAETIKEITELYATSHPALLGLGWGGTDKYAISDVTGHAAIILGSLTGNIGVSGGGAGVVNHHFLAANGGLGAWPIPAEFVKAETKVHNGYLPLQDNPTKIILCQGNGLQQMFAWQQKTNEWLDTLELVVTIDPFMTPSAELSDLILPTTTNFETEGKCGTMLSNRNHILLQGHVLDPLFESKSDFQIEKELAAAFGVDKYLAADMAEYNNKLLSAGKPTVAGITVETLLENQCVQRAKVPTTPAVGHLDQKYGTPSGKLELYYENQIEYDQALPTYVEALEANANNPLAANYPLKFSQPHSRFLVHSQFSNSQWIHQVCDGPRMSISSADAQARGLSTGDVVLVRNDRGNFKVPCTVSESIRPGHVIMSEGWWPAQLVDGSLQNVTNNQMVERQAKLKYSMVIAYYDTRVEVEKA